MWAIGRFFADLLMAFLAGVLSFFVALLALAGMVVMGAIALVGTMFTLVAAFEGIGWAVTGTRHAAVTTLGYLAYAACTFAIIPMLGVAWGSLTQPRSPRVRAPRAPLRLDLHAMPDVPFGDEAGTPRLTHVRRRSLDPAAVVIGAALLVVPVRAHAQPPVVQYDGDGRPVQQFYQQPDGSTLQEDWRGRPEGTWTQESTGPVFRDWRGIPVGK